MERQVLITGGAGFIGSHVTDELLRHGYRVRILDNLCEQVHGAAGDRPPYLHPDAELMRGDVRNPHDVRRALDGVQAVYHLAAAVGVGQSMYQLRHYVDTNDVGTAVLLEGIIDARVERLVVASSMSIYGEGLYARPDGSVSVGEERTAEQLQRGAWEVQAADGTVLEPRPTPESKPPSLASVYALSKYDQERLCLMIGRAYRLPTVALRFFNVYGPRQALSNPYTGVLAIFASRLLNGRAPMIFEDGLQRRDFVHVRDVAVACRLALESDAAAGHALNIGSGESFTVREIASRVAVQLGRGELTPDITAKYRVGDVRHCFADISLARRLLGYAPTVSLDAGLADLTEWLEGQVAHDRVEHASAELAARGLTV